MNVQHMLLTVDAFWSRLALPTVTDRRWEVFEPIPSTKRHGSIRCPFAEDTLPCLH